MRPQVNLSEAGKVLDTGAWTVLHDTTETTGGVATEVVSRLAAAGYTITASGSSIIATHAGATAPSLQLASFASGSAVL